MTTDRGWIGPAAGWGGVGAAMQLALALLGHWLEPVASWFGVLGPVTALAIGLLFAFSSRPGFGRAAAGGALAGGLGGVAGVLLSWLLGDVTLLLVGFGSGVAAAAGGLGGLLGQLVARPVPRRS